MPLDTIILPHVATNAHDELLVLLGLAAPTRAARSKVATPVLDAEEDEDDDEADPFADDDEEGGDADEFEDDDDFLEDDDEGVDEESDFDDDDDL